MDFLKHLTLRGISPLSCEEISDSEVLREIYFLKKKYSKDILILAHHYQNEEIIPFADATGDSLELAKQISKYKSAQVIIFCGVHFMAETADILSLPEQQVVLPDPEAGCTMADMASIKDIESAWITLTHSTKKSLIPITYVNSTAELKSFVGKWGGTVCTSSNAENAIRWALTQGKRIFFFPDQHLGRNTCFHQLHIPLNQMALYDPTQVDGGLSKNQIHHCNIFLWYGYCSVHQGFTQEHIRWVRKNYPSAMIIVHPECIFDVVKNSDLSGSTSFIVKTISEASEGAQFFVGTEINLVNRLAKRFPNKFIKSLSPFQCLCTTMYRIRPRWLLHTLRQIDRHEPLDNVIHVSDTIKTNALKALNRMMDISK